jgi:orotidine-5'-phosphate decarboxylase
MGRFSVMNRTGVPEAIVALDVSSRSALESVLERLPPEANFFKVGLELFCAEGPSVMSVFERRRARVFLDLKLHDIPRTVERAVRAVVQWRVEMLTIHAAGGPAMIRAAVEAAHSSGPRAPKIVAVTVLTSLDAADFSALGLSCSPEEQTRRWAELACQNGADGVVCSAREVGDLRRMLGPDAYLVTPGIRLAGGAPGDQKRTASPEQAALYGADAVVVGRPILEAPDPALAWRDLVAALRRVAAGRARACQSPS